MRIINGIGGQIVSTIKANYYKMGIRNYLFTRSDGFSASCVMIEYEP